MRIEKINENKIKILIDPTEAKAWKISCQTISENTPEVQEMFSRVIRFAEQKIDFSLEGAKLFVETIRELDQETDGVGVLLTRVFNQEELDLAVRQCGYQGRLKRSTIRRRVQTGGTMMLYRFYEFDDLCEAVSRLGGRFTRTSTLYKEKNTFYLHLADENPQVLREAEPILSEFGKQVENGRYMLGYLNEYGQVMIRDRAQEVLMEYFCVGSLV